MLTRKSLIESIERARLTILDRNTFALGDELFGIRNLISADDVERHFERDIDDIRFAEDDCGNFFTLSRTDGKV